MKCRKGFSLIELLVAVLIFGFMLTSMATIYSTANKHMFQNYRNNQVKTQLTAATKLIKSRLSMATRIDIPSFNNNSDILAFASNVDASGCYPVNSAVNSSWHYFCVSNGNLYYHTGPISGGGGCPSGSPWNPNNVYSFIQCNNLSGTLSGETVLLVANNIATPLGGSPTTAYPSNLFVRTVDATNTPLERNVVRIRLRVLWNPPVGYNYDLRQTARTIDMSMETYISASMAAR